MIRVSDLTNFLRCPRLSYFRMNNPVEIPTELKAAKEIFLSLRKGFDYEWAFNRFNILYPDSKEIFISASSKFVFSDELEKLTPKEWEVHLYSDKLNLKGVLDELHERSFLLVSLRMPESGIAFRDKIKIGAYSLLSKLDNAYIYYCYDGKLVNYRVGRRDKYNAIRVLEKVKKISRGVIPERKEIEYCSRCEYTDLCSNTRSTFASKFL